MSAAPPPRPPIEGHALVFAEEFEGDRLDPARWSTRYWWGGRSLPSNGEAQYYADRATELVRRHPGLDPFRVADGVLAITAAPSPDPALSEGLPWVSGLIATRSETGVAFAREGGWFEIRARAPAGRGLWPAFWLLPADGRWPPEIDVMEALGRDPGAYYAGLHWADSAGGERRRDTRRIVAGADLSAGFRTFAAHWTGDRVRFLLDGAERASIPAPPGLEGPMYLLAGLAVGGDWGGPPDASTPFPATFRIEHIRVWAPAGTAGAGV